MATSKVWDQYDAQFKLTERAEAAKKLAMDRAIKFNTFFRSETPLLKISDQIADGWRVMMTAPRSAIRLDKQLQISSSVVTLAKGILSTVRDGASELIRRGRDDYNPTAARRRKPSSASTKKRDGDSLTDWLKSSLGLGSKSNSNHRGNPINPWDSPFKHLPGLKKKKKPKGFTSFIY